MQGIGHFTDMVSAVSHDKCLDTITEMKAKGRLEESSNLKCLWPKYHGCLRELESHDTFKGVVIKAEHETKSVNTRLAKHNNALTLATKADVIVKTNLLSLTKRLESDLRDGTFEKETWVHSYCSQAWNQFCRVCQEDHQHHQ